MMRCKLILSRLVIACAALPAPAAEHYAIAPVLIAATLSRVGIEVQAAQVSLLTNVMASTPSPRLKVSSVAKLDRQQILARLECENTRECLPFYVSVRAGQGSEIEAVRTSTDSPSPEAIPGPADSSTVLRKGSPARLLLEGGNVHISIPVICLEAGAPGQTIRVSDKEHHMVYSAQVVSAFLLKGALR